MLALLLAPENLIFSTALALMVLIGVVEALGFGLSAFDTPGELDLAGDAGSPLLDWLGFGRLPLLIVLVAGLASFGMCGIVIQQAASSWIGQPLSAPLAVVGAALIGLPLTAMLSRGLARILPTDETTAVSLDSLVGRRGHVVLGTATAGSPARARVRDAFGQSHYLLVEPNLPGQHIAEGDEILLVGRDGGHFRAIAIAPHLTLEEGAAA